MCSFPTTASDSLLRVAPAMASPRHGGVDSAAEDTDDVGTPNSRNSLFKTPRVLSKTVHDLKTPRVHEAVRGHTERSLLSAHLREARHLELLMDEHVKNAQWRRRQAQYSEFFAFLFHAHCMRILSPAWFLVVCVVRGWVPLVFRTLCGRVFYQLRLLRQKRGMNQLRERIAVLKLARMQEGPVRSFMLHKAIANWVHHAMGRGWRSWQETRALAYVQRRRLQSAVAAFRGQSAARAVRTWRPHGERRALLRRALRALVAHEALRAYNAWVAHAQARRHTAQLIRRASTAFRWRQTRRASNTWVEAAAHSASFSRALQMGSSIFVRHTSRKCFNSLARAALMHSMAIARLRFATAAMVNRCEKKAWNSWTAHARARGALQNRRATCLAAFMHKQLRRAGNSWIGHAKARSNCMRKLRLGLSVFNAAKVRRCWNTHSTEAASGKRRKELIRTSLMRMRHRGQSAGFQRWAQSRAARKAAALKATLALAEWQRKGPRRAWIKWRASSKVHGTVRAAVRNLQERGLRLGLNSWSAQALERAEALRKLRLGMSAFTMGMTRRFWYAYSSKAFAHKRRTELVRAALAKMVHRGLTLGFSSWQAAWEGHRRSLSAVRIAIQDWQRKGPRRAWFTWRALASVRTKLKAALLSLVEHSLRRALNSWIVSAQGRSTIFRKLRLGTSIFTKGAMRRSWNTYSSLAASSKRREVIVHAAVFRMRHRGLTEGFGSWSEALVRRKTGTRRTKLAVLEWQRKGPRRGWLKWRSLASVYSKLIAATRNLVQRHLRFGLNSWISTVAAHRRSLRLTRLGVSAMRDQQRRRAANKWNEYAEQRADAVRKLRLGISAFASATLRRFWNSYTSIAKSRIHSQALMSNAINRLTHRSVSMGLASWVQCWNDRKTKHRKVELAIAQWQRRGPRGAWFKWLIVASIHTALKAGLRGLAKRGLRAGMNSWIFQVRRSQHAQRLLFRGASAFCNNQLRESTNSWIVFSRERRADLSQLSRGVRAFGARLRRQGLNSWASFSEGRHYTLRLLEVSLRGMRYGKQRRVVNTWRAYAQIRTQRIDLVRKSLGSLQLREQARAMRSWMYAVRSEWRIQMLVKLKSSVAAARSVSSLFRIWMRACLSSCTVSKIELRRSHQAVARYFLQYLSREQIQAAWTHWRGMARLRGNLAVRMMFMHERESMKEAVLFWKDMTRLRFGNGLRTAMRQIDTLKENLVAAMKGKEGIAKMTSDLQVTMAERDELQAKLKAARHQADEVDAQKRKLDDELAGMRVTAESARDDLRNELANLREEQKKAQREADAAKWEADAMLQERDARISALEAALEEANTRAKALEQAKAQSEAIEQAKARAATEALELEKARAEALEKARAEALEQARAEAKANAAAETQIKTPRAGLFDAHDTRDAGRVNVGTSTGLKPVATLSVDTSGQLLSAQLHLEDSARSNDSQPILIQTESPAPRTRGALSAPSARRTPRSPSPRPTNASRGWRMSFSPDWKHDADASSWHEWRRATVGRTAARHVPWISKSPASNTHSPPRFSEVASSSRGEPTEYRVVKRELAEKGVLSKHSEPETTIAHRSRFAWSQHAFEGGHVKESAS